MTARRRAVLASGGFAALAAFVALAVFVTRDVTAPPHLDQSWHEALRRFGIDHPAWLKTMRAITHLGDAAVILVVDVALFATCLYRRRPRLAAFVAVIGLGGWALRILVRQLVGRPRPGDALWPENGASFPSGHATNSALMLALVMVVCWPLVGSAARWAMAVAATGVALAVGLSRIAGGVHWPTDVLGGWALAAAYTCLVAAVFARVGPGQEPAGSALNGRAGHPRL